MGYIFSVSSSKLLVVRARRRALSGPQPIIRWAGCRKWIFSDGLDAGSGLPAGSGGGILVPESVGSVASPSIPRSGPAVTSISVALPLAARFLIEQDYAAYTEEQHTVW